MVLAVIIIIWYFEKVRMKFDIDCENRCMSWECQERGKTDGDGVGSRWWWSRGRGYEANFKLFILKGSFWSLIVIWFGIKIQKSLILMS